MNVVRKTLLAAGFVTGTSVSAAIGQTDLQALIDAAEEGATVEIAEDVTISSPLSISKSVTLASPAGATNTIIRSGNPLFFTFGADAPTLTLRDLVCDGNSSGGSVGRVVSLTNGTLVVSSGATIRNVENGGNYGALLMEGTARLVMEEGAVFSAFANKRYAPCVCLMKGTVFDMTGGVITNCYGRYDGGSYDYDGAVYVYGGAFNLSGGRIVGNGSASSTAGVDVEEGSFTMTGGLIAGNSGAIGGVYCHNGTVTMSGGLVTGNSGTYAGGFYMLQGTFNLSGDATITNNVGGTVNDLYLAGDTDYYQTTQKNPPANCNISTNFTGFATVYTTYEPYDSSISSSPYESWVKNFFVSPASACAQFGRISCQDYPEFVFHGSRTSDKWIYWRKPVCRVNGVPFVTVDDVETTLSQERLDVELCRDFTWTKTFAPRAAAETVLLHSPAGTNYTLKASGDATVVSVVGSNTTLRLENIVLSGSSNVSQVASVSHGRLELGPGAVLEKGRKGVQLVHDDAVLTMEEGSVIRDTFNPGETSFGFAVQIGQYVQDLGRHTTPTFVMTGGLVTNCTGGTGAGYPASSGYGGAVYVYDGEFRMSGGKIAGNVCSNSSAGVMLYSGRALFGGSAVVENNVGEAPDLYVYGSRSAYFFGDFRGRVGVSSGGQSAGSSFKVWPEAGATGAWCFFAAANETADRLIGASRASGEAIVWAAAAGSVDGVPVATAADAGFLLPKALDVGEAGRAKLPHVLAGVAAGATGSVALEGCEADELTTAGVLPLTLFACTDGAFTGKISFVLPEACRERLIVRRRGDKYVLDGRRGALVILR